MKNKGVFIGHCDGEITTDKKITANFSLENNVQK